MADSVTEPPKDKVKKKKSSLKKNDATKEKSDAPKEKAAPPAAAPEAASEAAPEAAAVPQESLEAPPEKPASRKPSSAAEVSAEAAVEGSPVDPSSRKSSTIPPEAQPEQPEAAATEPAVDVAPQPETPKRRQSEIAPKKKKSANKLEELDEEKLIELKEAFELFDLDGDGFIDLPDLKLTFASLGRPDITDEELKAMLSEGKNPMDFDSFVMLLGFKTIAMDPEETLRNALSAWDYRDTGFISQERITHALMTRGDPFTKDEAHGAFEDAPTFITDGEPMIDYIKFCRMLGGLRKEDTTSYDN